ncbi:replication factor C large subunit [Candidatus Mancarchaeum acidiphilum]|uniref:Replication factor C large subunit n=1 Tax=Candidatus Mancarchaeum acidiphilum TaxID=1920749 RepID=A0A218NND3_9ARCH|nr:AAA family ATPase [Candidatus Mancarchaeum acidiphilum]ASI13970.1 replication factor C large subunit [Candidatus Mancarchaeum acidiphilum]
MDIDELYRFDSLDEFYGNKESIDSITLYLKNFSPKEKRKPLLVYGPTGTGKTSIVKFLAEKLGYNIINLDASDYRDKDSIEKQLFYASNSMSLSNKRNMILLDEIDNLDLKFDKGASSAITELIKISVSPIIFIANDAYDKGISFLRDKADKVEFKKLNEINIRKLLSGKADKFGIRPKSELIDYIAKAVNGDARAAINDLYAVYAGGIEDDGEYDGYNVVGLRDKTDDIFSFLNKVFSSITFSSPLHALSLIDLTPDMTMQWLAENIPKIYKGNDLASAFNMLSLATVYNSRAVRRQHYAYWRYMNIFMTSGVALSKSRYYTSNSRYSYPKMIKERGIRKDSNAKMNEISIDLKHMINESVFTIKEYYLPLIKEMIRSNSKDGILDPESYEFFSRKYGLNAKEVDWIKDNSL